MAKLLECKNTTKYYGQGASRFAALKKVSLAFPETGLVAIVGHSGSGKSTLLSLLSGMEKEDRGGVYYRGRKLSEIPPREMASIRSGDLAMVFQHYNLIEGASVLENASLPLSMQGQSKAEAKNLIERFGLAKLSHRSVDHLSGGEKQRVALCRALASSPSILFADEPTGALDETNSIAVMDALKEESKERLVILVSHNLPLVERYADAVVELRDGSIASKTGNWQKKPAKGKRIPKRHSRKWTWPFLFRNLSRHRWKNIVCALSGVVGFASIALSVGFFIGNKEALRQEQTKVLDYQVASLSEKTVIELPSSPLSLVQTSRPKRSSAYELLSSIPSVSVENDYSYFFPSSCAFRLDDVACDPASILPIYDITLKEGNQRLLVQGKGAIGNSFDCCLVNKEFASFYDEDCLGKLIRLENACSVSFADVKDDVYFNAEMRIVGVVEEFSFLNSPKIYYSFQGLEAKLMETSLPHISTKQGKETNVKTFVDEAEPTSCYGSYRCNVFVHDFEDVPLLYEKINELEAEDRFSLMSTAYTIASSFSSLSTAFETSLFLFVGIALIGLCLILGMSSYSNFIERKKESAILLSLGARFGDVLSIFSKESGLLCVASSLLSLLLTPLLEFLANRFLKSQFGMDGMVRVPLTSFLNVPFLLPALLVVGSLAIGMISTLLPLSLSKGIPLREELSDE